jgi:threonine/homoserine/homoserine lactone efflux protein
MCGIATLLASWVWLRAAVQLAGAAYLIWLGVEVLRRAVHGTPMTDGAAEAPSGTAWRMGMQTSVTNPKSGAFWTSIFATTFPPHASVWLYAATLLMIAGLSAGWHLGLAVALSSASVQTRYRRLRRPIDILCGLILVSFGLRLATSR